MKLAVILIALTALSWHHGAMGQRECQCDCTCPSTTGIPECDAETTSELPLTTTPELTTTTTPEPTTTTTPEPTTTTPWPTTTTTIPTTTPTPFLDCGVNTIEEGIPVTLQSPNYPEKYGKKDKCEWELTCSSANGVISVSCEEFKTDPKKNGEKCKDTDYVRIRDGSGDKLGDFCGTKGPELTTSDNYMKFKFRTDGDSTKKSGFSCQVLCSIPTTTTPVDLTTKDIEGVYSGMCSNSWTAEVGSTTWESPFYDGTTNYPKNDYCCWLNITIPSSFSMFLVTLTMNGNSKLHETAQCTGDKITYYSSTNTESTLCGDLSGQSWSETAVFNTPLSFGFQWCSDSSDDGTDVGFSMEIIGKDLNPGRK